MKRRPILIHSLIAALMSATLGLLPVVSEAATPRANWVVSQLYAFNHPYAAQLPGELATKMGKMAAGPFAFYRGTAHLFYLDMATRPASAFCNAACSQTWLNGDMHLQNLGAFRDAAGNFVFDTNDFDEGYWGPYVWDLRRMAVSIVLAAGENGLSASDQQQLVRDFLDNYINKIGEFRGSDSEPGYRLTSANTSGVVKDTIAASASQSTSALLSRYTSVTGGRRAFKNTDDLAPISAGAYAAVEAAVASYVSTIAPGKRQPASFYGVKDIRQKLGSGIGSLGRYRYYVLIEGPGSGNGDDVILQMKQQAASAVALAHDGAMPATVYESHEGERAAKSMKAALSNTDVLLGWTSIGSTPYLVREKSPYEADFNVTRLTSYDSFSAAVQYAGKLVAKNHASADKDHDATLIPYSLDKEIDELISTNKSGFRDEIVRFAVDYAAQVRLDYQSFLSAWQSGVPLY